MEDKRAEIPLSLGAEQALIGSVLIAPECLEEAAGLAGPADFSVEVNGGIFSAALSLLAEGARVDAVTILTRCRARGMDGDGKLAGYFRELMDLTPTAANAGEYARLVKNAATLRAVRGVGLSLAQDAGDGADAAAVVSGAMEALERLGDGARGAALLTPEAQVRRFLDYRDEIERDPLAAVVRTGYGSLDALLGGGMMREGLYIIGARPGMGKTTFALNLAENISRSGEVLFVSLEMSDRQIMGRRLAREARLRSDKLMMQRLTDEEEAQLMAASRAVLARRIVIPDVPGATVGEIALWARSLKQLRAVVVDYIGLITPDKKRPGRYDEMTDVSGALKRMARSLRVPVIALSQLNRANEARQNKRPQLSDLRDTGAIEQDADAVIFLHREDYYDGAAEGKPQDAQQLMELIVAKNRHGNTGTRRMAWDGAQGRVTGLATTEPTGGRNPYAWTDGAPDKPEQMKL